MNLFRQPFLIARIGLILSAICFVILYPNSMWSNQEGWMWNTPQRNVPFENMLVSMYIVNGLFLAWAARDPIRYLPLIDFTIVANIVHGFVMLNDALKLGLEANLRPGGDVMGTFIVPVILLLTHPRKFYLDGLFVSKAAQ
jgi:hypothetical protein